MKKYSLIVCALILLSFPIPSRAFMEPAAMGGIQTVLPSGALDAGRNPALLPFEDSRSSFAAVGSYRYLENDSISTKASTMNGTLTIDTKNEDVRTFSTYAGFAVRGNTQGFGILFASTGDPLYDKTKMTSNFNVQSTSPAFTAQSKETDTSTNLNPAIIMGWGIKTSPSGTFGIRFTGGMNQKTDESKEHTEISGATQDFTSKDVNRSLFGELLIGFFYRDGGIDGGATISSGHHGKWDQEFSYTLTKTPSSGTTSGKEKNSTSYLMSSSPIIAVGFSITPVDKLKIGFELTSIMPKSYSQKNLFFDTNTNTIGKQSVEHNVDYNYSAKIGLKFSVLQNLSLFAGVQGIMQSETTDTKGTDESHARERTYVFVPTAGFDFAPSDRITLGIASTFIFYHSTSKSNDKNGSLSFKLRGKQGDIIAGLMIRL
ncbi:MAG TPA: hypothetical protein VF857_05105 [Spirochaetota bacterium]